MSGSSFVQCPCCGKSIPAALINEHLDQNCRPDSARVTSAPGAGMNSATRFIDRPHKRASLSSAETPASTKRTRALDEASAKHPREQSRRQQQRPLADRMRPRTIDEVCGQEAALATLRPLLESRALPSLILWGPPGCGKTSFAAVSTPHIYISSMFKAKFEVPLPRSLSKCARMTPRKAGIAFCSGGSLQ
eukprot:SAG31_NODE_1696_length_7503_cov_45.737574_8_plen_191_part_00